MTRFVPLILIFVIQLAFIPSVVVSDAPGMVASFPVPDEGAIVYDENANGTADLLGDTWVFDPNQDGHADLIIRFRQNPLLTAEIYDDTNTNGQVDYRIGLSEVQVLETHWRVKLTARDGTWTLPDGSSDWNLDLQADSGFVFRRTQAISTAGTCRLAEDSTAIALLDQTNDSGYGAAAVDAQTDFQIRYWDQNKDGIPDYEWRNINWAGRNDLLVVNANPNLRYKATHRFPPLETLLRVEWNSARLTYINSLIPAYLNEAGYFLTFNHKTVPNQINAAFENPFAFYDLHGNQDCNSELKLRAVTEAADRSHNNLSTYSEVRYSWAQDTEAIQYRLYLIGQVYTDAVWQYPVYPVAHIGYADLPAFLLKHSWRGASFAEAEPDMAKHSFADGISENLFYTPALRAVVLDSLSPPLPSRYLPAYLNLREEYNLTHFNNSPHLYFSPIDRRLHLLGSQAGVVIFAADTSNSAPGFDFNQKALGSGELAVSAETVYADTDSDGYVDTWVYRENGQDIQQLVIRPGVALLAAKNSLDVKKLPADVTVSAWEAAPPSDTAGWKSLEAQLVPAQAGRRPLNDLPGIFSNLPGEVVTLPGTVLTSVSIQNHGLYAGVSTLAVDLPSDSSLLLTGKLPAGNYILRVRDGIFALENLSPQAPELSVPVLNSPPPGQVDQLMGLLSFSVKNPGNTDITAHINVLDTVSRSTVLLNQDKTIPAAGQVDFSLPWASALPGAHHLLFQVDAVAPGDSQPIHLSQQLNLQASGPDFGSNAILLTEPYFGATGILILLLVGFVAIGTWATIQAFEKNDEIND